MKIGIITDSACDLKLNEIDNEIVKIIPMNIIIDDKSYRDGVDISTQYVYEVMDEKLPKTSLPKGEDISLAIEYFIKNNFQHIICIFISQGFSGTLNAFKNISELYKDKIDFTIINTKNISMAQGACVIESMKLINEGKSACEIENKIYEKLKNIDTFFVLDTLDYLIRGGRVGKVSGTIGKLLKLLPLIHVSEEGSLHTYYKAIGKSKVKEKLLNIVKNDFLDKGKCKIYGIHGGVEDELDELIKELKEHGNLINIDKRLVNPSLSVHTGKGLVGFIVERIF